MPRKKNLKGAEVLRFRVDDDLMAQMQSVMSALGTTNISDFVRRSIAQQVEREKARIDLEAEIAATERERALAAARKKVNEQIRKDAGYQPYTPAPEPDPELDAERAALELEAQAHDAKNLKAAEE